jgi:hypothetical protein
VFKKRSFNNERVVPITVSCNVSFSGSLLGLNWVVAGDVVRVVSPLALMVAIVMDFVNGRKRRRRRR